MARIAGINIPQNKIVSIALTYIHGIGLHSSKKICEKLNVPWVYKSCTQLYGPKYALLRQEFSDLRKHSIERRKNSTLKNLLITMGGKDKDNAVCRVLEVLNSIELF